MNKIFFITLPSNTHRTAEENIGIGYLTSILRNHGFDVSIIDGWLYNLSMEEIIREIRSVKSILFIGFSCYALSFDVLSNLIKAIKKIHPQVITIAGGYGPTFHNDKFLNAGIDFTVCGEGEEAILKIASSLSNSQDVRSIAGVSFLVNGEPSKFKKTETISDLDSIPLPARDTLNQTIKLKNPAHIVTSRGCYGDCSFCSINSFYSEINSGKKWRQRSLENIIEEIKILYHEFGITCFKFLDDSFLEPPRDVRWVEKFANSLKKQDLKIKFRTQIRANRLTGKIASTLADCGWFATSIGIENFSDSALKRMNKSARKDDNLRALDILRENNIYTQMGLILFDHKTTIKELEDNYNILKELEWPITKGIFSEMYAAEGTTFSRKLKYEKNIKGSNNGNLDYDKEKETSSIYNALKKWQKSHSKIYDRSINPLSAPKFLPDEGYMAYHAICMELYRRDLDFLKNILILNGKGSESVEIFSNKEIAKTIFFYEAIDKKLELLDRQFYIDFNAKTNPFL